MVATVWPSDWQLFWGVNLLSIVGNTLEVAMFRIVNDILRPQEFHLVKRVFYHPNLSLRIGYKIPQMKDS